MIRNHFNGIVGFSAYNDKSSLEFNPYTNVISRIGLFEVEDKPIQLPELQIDKQLATCTPF